MSGKERYGEPGSFARVQEAGIAIADADSDDDAKYHAAKMRLRQAVAAHAPRILGALGGRAAAARMTAEQRSDRARNAIKSRWARIHTAKNEKEPGA